MNLVVAAQRTEKPYSTLWLWDKPSEDPPSASYHLQKPSGLEKWQGLWSESQRIQHRPQLAVTNANCTFKPGFKTLLPQTATFEPRPVRRRNAASQCLTKETVTAASLEQSRECGACLCVLVSVLLAGLCDQSWPVDGNLSAFLADRPDTVCIPVTPPETAGCRGETAGRSGHPVTVRAEVTCHPVTVSARR